MQSFIQKALTALKDRPTYLFQYGRGLLLFYWARALAPVFVHSERVQLEPNVRFQNIRNFLCATSKSRIRVGAHSVIYEHARLESHGDGIISIGASSVIGDTRIVCRNKITVGERFLTSWNTLIQDFDPHPTSQTFRAQQLVKITQEFTPRFTARAPLMNTNNIEEWTPPSAEIWIGDDVWVGANACILKGTRIGHGSIVAAGSVVTGGDFPDRSLIAGNPARRIKELPA